MYAYQNPVRYTDPTGKVPVLDEVGQGLSDVGDSLIDQAANADSAGEAIAYGVGAGANYFVSGVVATVNFGLNIAGSQGWLGDGVQNRATSELHEAFDTIQTLVEDPKGTASAIASNVKNTAVAAASGDTKSIAKVAAAATSLLGAKPNVSVATAVTAVATTTKNVAVGTGTVLRNTARQIAKNASQPSRGQMFGQRGAVGDLGQSVANEVNYLYRGVSAKHPALGAAQKGNIVPGNINGTVTPDMHNAGGHAANSPFTSWSRDPSIAAQHAAKDGNGGVILRVPQGAPPKGSQWNWDWSPDIYGEQEVLMKGVRTGVEVLK